MNKKEKMEQGNLKVGDVVEWNLKEKKRTIYKNGENPEENVEKTEVVELVGLENEEKEKKREESERIEEEVVGEEQTNEVEGLHGEILEKIKEFQKTVGELKLEKEELKKSNEDIDKQIEELKKILEKDINNSGDIENVENKNLINLTENDLEWSSLKHYEPSGEWRFVIGENSVCVTIREKRIYEKISVFKELFVKNYKRKQIGSKWQVFCSGNKDLNKKYDGIYQFGDKAEAMDKLNEIVNEGIRINEKEGSEIAKDRAKRPFTYYLIDKIKHKYVHFSHHRGDTFNIDGLMDYEFLHYISNNEGFFTFSSSGFLFVIKNVDEITKEKEEKRIIDGYRDEAIYKIIDPNGNVIDDNIKGYENADKIFKEKVKEYEDKIYKEFKKENPNLVENGSQYNG